MTREEAIEILKHLIPIPRRGDSKSTSHLLQTNALAMAIKALEQEPKTGHWIYDNFNWRCSECNETPKTSGYVGTADFMTEHFKFCNHCGARMIEPQESEEEG